MKLRAGLKTAGFALACLAWLMGGLTLLGPLIATHTFASTDRAYMGPTRPLASLECPRREPGRASGLVVARIANHSGRSQTYQAVFDVTTAGSFSPPDMPRVCVVSVPLRDGETGAASCAVETGRGVDMQVRVTAWTASENDFYTCANGCPNSYSSTCVITGDIWAQLIAQGTLVSGGAILAVGVVLVAIGAVMWRRTGQISRIVMGIAFSVAALSLAVVANAAYAHWLPAVILLVAMGKACLVAWLLMRGAERRALSA